MRRLKVPDHVAALIRLRDGAAARVGIDARAGASRLGAEPPQRAGTTNKRFARR